MRYVNLFVLSALEIATPSHAGDLITFDGPVVTPFTSVGSGAIVSGSLPGVYAAPWGDATNYLAVTGTNDLLFTVGAKDTYVRLLHGSVDSYNVLQLLGAGGSVISTHHFVGNGDQGPAGTMWQTFHFAAGSLTGLRFMSNTPAFEVDNITTGVPEPKSWALMVAGFGLVGFALRQRKAAAATITA